MTRNKSQQMKPPAPPETTGVRRAIHTRCQLCDCALNAERPTDNFVLGVCTECRDRPEAPALRPALVVVDTPVFGPAERSLIQKLHGHLPAQQLLDLLNERRRADRGASATPYTMALLHEAIPPKPAMPAAGDWGALRKLLMQARRDGVLGRISRQTIEDFAIIWSLSPGQVMRLKDAVFAADGAEHG